MNQNYTYNGRVFDNTLVFVQTGCWKITFVQNLARHKMFGKLKSVDWISKITLSKAREEQITSCFKDTQIGFSYLNDINEFNGLIENFQRKTEKNNNDNDNFLNNYILGWKKIIGQAYCHGQHSRSGH